MMKSEFLDTYHGIKVRKNAFGREDRGAVDEVLCADSYRLDIRHLMPMRNSYVIDVGAHIGVFARLWHFCNPAARIVCVEACPENWELLEVNVAMIAYVERAACTYEPGPITLYNTAKGSRAGTMGSVVLSQNKNRANACLMEGHIHDHPEYYVRDERPLRKITLEEIMAKYELPRIDCLKLDCEGSEFSILEDTPSLDEIGFICGEYHGREPWEQMLSTRFKDWQYCHLSGSECGMFHLQNPRWEAAFKPNDE